MAVPGHRNGQLAVLFFIKNTQGQIVDTAGTNQEVDLLKTVPGALLDI